MINRTPKLLVWAFLFYVKSVYVCFLTSSFTDRSLFGINSVQALFKEIRIKPRPAGDLAWAKGSYHSIRGKIECDWCIDVGTFALNVTIPLNTTAEVWLPKSNNSSIKKGNKPLIASDTIKYLETKNSHALYEIGSANYSFTCQL